MQPTVTMFKLIEKLIVWSVGWRTSTLPYSLIISHWFPSLIQLREFQQWLLHNFSDGCTHLQQWLQRNLATWEGWWTLLASTRTSTAIKYQRISERVPHGSRGSFTSDKWRNHSWDRSWSLHLVGSEGGRTTKVAFQDPDCTAWRKWRV